MVGGLEFKDQNKKDKTCFKAWRKGTSGTTLVTVVVPEGSMDADTVLEFLKLHNGLSSLWQFRLSKTKKPNVRLATFGVAGKDVEILQKMKERKSFIRFGLSECKFTISGKRLETINEESTEDQEATQGAGVDGEASKHSNESPGAEGAGGGEEAMEEGVGGGASGGSGGGGGGVGGGWRLRRGK